MFRSAKGADKSSALQRVTTNDYTSFQEPSTSSHQQTESRKRTRIDLSDESSESDLNDDIIVDYVRTKTSHKKKDKKHKKDKKKHKKKKRRRDSSSSEPNVQIKDEPFVVERTKTLSNHNYKFERAIKSLPLKMETYLPITKRDSFALKLLVYGSKEQSERRYFDSGNKDELLREPTERTFRDLSGSSLFTNGEMTVSTKPYDPSEDIDFTTNDDDFNVNISSKERKFANFDQLSSEQKMKRVKNDIGFAGDNLNNWLEFLKLEDEDFACVAKLNKASTGANRNSFLERRLEIIKQGRKKVGHKDSLQLDLEYVRTATELYQYFDNRVTDEWNKLLRNRVNSFEFWKAYIQQFLHNSNVFSYTDMLNQFDTAIERLSGLYNGTIQTHKALPGTDLFLTDLVVNRTRLLKEVGNVSAVVAILQAVAEFFFFTPSHLKSKFWPDRLIAFDEFWTIAVPRLGDKKAKGWKDSRIVSTECDEEGEFGIEAELVEQLEQQESELLNSLSGADDANRLITWHKLENRRSTLYWRPLKPLTRLIDSGPNESTKRLVVFSIVKTSLLPIEDSKLKLQLLLRLLQILGAVIPGLDDVSQFGLLHAILPNDFNFLNLTYIGLSDFLIEFMFQLCASTEIDDIEQILVSIIATRVHFLEVENASSIQRKEAIAELQKRMFELDIGQEAKYCVMLQLYETILEQSDLCKSLTGSSLREVFDNQRTAAKEKRCFEILLDTLAQSFPWDAAGEHQRQILFRSAFFIATYLPSTHTGCAKHRLRFLTFLVLNQTDRFLDENYEFTAELVEDARRRWSNYMQDTLRQDDQSTNAYLFMETSSDLIFMLYSFFEFEYSKDCPFTDAPILRQDIADGFIERSATRSKFRLDFSHEMWKEHVCQWPNYSKWTLDALTRHAEVPAIYRHLANVYGATPCRFRLFVEWKNMHSNLKRERAFAMFAAEFLLFKQACELDDRLLIDQSYKRIRQILEEAAPLLSDTHVPDSSIWRLWHYIERERKNRTEMEKVYLLGVQSCPFSKQLLVDVTSSLFTPKSKLEEIKDLADKFGLHMCTLPSEADILLEAAVKHKQPR